jgi:putative permease
MTLFRDQQLRRDLFKISYLAAAVMGMAALFLMNPTLSTPTVLSIVASMLLSPWVASLERRGHPRTRAIAMLFGAGFLALAAGGFSAARSGNIEWGSLKEKAPQYLAQTVAKLRDYETSIKRQHPMFDSVQATDAVIAWAQETGQWFKTHGAGLAGDVLTWLLLVPFLTFVLLNEGPVIRRRLFSLVPNRFFETVYSVTMQITNSLADYLRAKLVEAFLVGLLTTLGLWVIGAPYAIVLGVISGATNILPYLGPVLGTVPALLIVALDPQYAGLVWPVAIVFLTVNVIDSVVIFPVIVAKLVNLHPLILIAVVAIGGKYCGLVGMLISIPIASVAKVVLAEIHRAVYRQRTIRPRPAAPATAPLREAA